MEFHPAKCTVAHIKDAQTHHKHMNHTGSSNINQVPLSKTYKRPALEPTSTISQEQSRKYFTLLQHNLHKSLSTIKTQAYSTNARPLAGYAATAWDPHTRENVRKLEMVQR